ncbi:MAG: glycosyltransferase [Acidobacteria bacterium]|nr:glycosyltransferase [Acidobacteriota bacterium]
MRILQISTCDQAGGAEKVAYDLHTAYRQRSHQAHLAVGHKKLNDPDVSLINHNAYRPAWTRFWRAQQLALCQKEIHVAPVLAGWLADAAEPRAWWERTRGLENFDYPGAWHVLDLPPQRPQVVHAHNLHGKYFDLRALAALSQQVPTFVTLHDEWMLTGHCAYTFGSERWRTGCVDCPDLAINPALTRNTTAQNWRRKQRIYQQAKLYIAAPSRWLLAEALDSILHPALIETRHIPNGVALETFHPGDKQAARAALQLPQDADIALFVANSTVSNPFKDYATLEAAIECVAATRPPRETVFVNLGEAGMEKQIGNVTVRFVGYQREPQQVARFYQAADVYLHAARAENFPCTILEALACGTPVVATAVGGIPEQISEGITGFLVPIKDHAALAARVTELFADAAKRYRMGAAAVGHAHEYFSLDRQVAAYLDWYQAVALDDKNTQR